MKNLFCLLMLTLLTASGCATGDYARTNDIEELRQEIQALRTEVQELKKAAVISQPRTIELPKAAVKPPEADTSYLVVSVSMDGQLFLAGKAATPEQLQEELRATVTKDPGIRVVVQADREVPYKKVIEVMDLVKTAGVENIAIATVKD